MQAVYKAFERNAALILASEQWAEGYHDAPEQYAKMLKTAARLERKLIVFFREQARTCDRFINWHAYAAALQEVKAADRLNAYDVNVIVTDNPEDDNQPFISVVFDDIATSMALGTQAAQATYHYTYGLPAVDHTIQQYTRQQVASLVGKRVLDDGTIIDNPNPDYVISNTTRRRIQSAVQTSLAMGENIEQTRKRVQAAIKDPTRAALIAHQEVANAYTKGVHLYGQASGAIGKQWRDNGAKDICAVNTAAGPIPFDDPYPGGVQHPTQHIGCRCYERLLYQNSLDENPKLFNKPKPKPAPAAAVKPAAKPIKPTTTPVATFTKGSKSFSYALNSVEHKIITDNNISMTTGPAPGRSRWDSSTHGMYVETIYGSKSMHIRQPGTDHARLTFYHEIGHAIDHNLQRAGITDRYANESPLAKAFELAYQADKQAIFNQRITENYLERGLTLAQIQTVLDGGQVPYMYPINGRLRPHMAKITTSFMMYAKARDEIFAHGYGYYRTNPALLKKIAPKLYNIYKEL